LSYQTTDRWENITQ